MKLEVKEHKKVNLKKLQGGKSVYVGYPEASYRTESDLTNAQIAFLNSEGTRPYNISRNINNLRDEYTSYNQALQAYIRSHGDPKWHIPPRPFLQPSIEENLEELSQDIKDIIISSVENRSMEDIQLTKLGIKAVNMVQKFIRDYPENNLTPNADSTIKKKGVDHPLIGKTGELLRGITYVIGE